MRANNPYKKWAAGMTDRELVEALGEIGGAVMNAMSVDAVKSELDSRGIRPDGIGSHERLCSGGAN